MNGDTQKQHQLSSKPIIHHSSLQNNGPMKKASTHLIPTNLPHKVGRNNRKETLKKGLQKLSLFALAIITLTQLSAQCTMVCNDQVNVSLPHSCEAEITFDMILEDPYNPNICSPNGPSAFIVTVMNNVGDPIPTSPFVTADNIGQLLNVKVKHWASSNSCWGSVQIDDKLGPQLLCPGDITIACSESTEIASTGDLTATDCSAFNVTHSDVLETFGCNNPTASLVRTWTAVDAHNNSSTCAQTLFITQPSFSAVQFPPNLDDIQSPALLCGNPNTQPSNTGEPTINGEPIETEGLCNMGVLHSDQEIPLCDGSYKILRTWTVADWCSGMVVSDIQIIKVKDDVGPTLACPPDLTVGTTSSSSCMTSTILPPVSAQDNCSSTFHVTMNVPNGFITGNGGLIHNLQIGTYSVTYTVSDDCGNTSTCVIDLTVVDDDAPAVVCDEITTVTLNPDGFATVPASVFDDGSYDNCCFDRFEARRMQAGCSQGALFAPEVVFCCEDIGQDVQVELQAIDCAGNTNSCMVIVHLHDNSAPVILCPPNKTITCTDDYEDTAITGLPVASDGCSVADLFSSDAVSINTCGVGIVSRTWVAVDDFGNSSSCIQTISLIDNTPVSVTFPNNYDVTGCGAIENLHPDSLPAPFNHPIITGDDCETMAVNFEDQLFTVAPPACFKILRTWKVIDWCVYVPNSGSNAGVYESTQVLKVFDEEAPIINCPNDVVVDILDACEGTVTLPQVTATDCSESVTVSVSSDFGNGFGDFTNVAIGTYQATYSAFDGCGNTASCTINITVKDAKLPTPYCKNGVTIELMPEDTDGDGTFDTGMVEVWASDFDAGSSDNCTGNLQFSFTSDVNTSNQTYNCNNIGQNTVELWVTDASGLQDFCETFLIIQDNQGACADPVYEPMLAGMVADEMGAQIENVTITINDGLNIPIITSADGAFEFSSLPPNTDYTLTPEKNLNLLNGVTTWDLVLIRRHILNEEKLNSPYKMIAADIDRSGTISTIDLVAARKVILFVEDEFVNNKSWRFVDADYNFNDPENPLLEDFPEVFNVNNLSDDMTDANFVGIKIGDVNNNAIPNNLLGSEDRTSGEPLVFEIENQKVQQGEEVRIDFRASDLQNHLGYQFTLQFDIENLEFERLETGALAGLSENNFGWSHLSEGVITTTWFSDKVQEMKEDAVAFSLVFTAYKTTQLNNILAINSSWTKAEAYQMNGETSNVVLEFSGGSGTLSFESTGDVELYQNYPNPFNRATIISFYLPETQEASVEVFDVSGSLLKKVEGLFVQGKNEVRLEAKELNKTGTLIYQLKTASKTLIGKMVVIN